MLTGKLLLLCMVKKSLKIQNDLLNDTLNLITIYFLRSHQNFCTCKKFNWKISYKSNTTGAISHAGSSYPFGAPKFTQVVSGVYVAPSLVFCVMFCRSLFVLFVLFLLAIVLSILFRYKYDHRIDQISCPLADLSVYLNRAMPPVTIANCLGITRQTLSRVKHGCSRLIKKYAVLSQDSKNCSYW
jgi:hypothetical protein